MLFFSAFVMSNVHGFIASQGVQIPKQPPQKPLRDRRAIAELARITPSQIKRQYNAEFQETGSGSPAAPHHDGKPLNLKRFIQKSKAQSPLDPNESDYNSFDDTSTTLETVTGEQLGYRSKRNVVDSNLEDVHDLNNGLDDFFDGRASDSDMDYVETLGSSQKPQQTEGTGYQDLSFPQTGISAGKGLRSSLSGMLDRPNPEEKGAASTDTSHIGHQYHDNHSGVSSSDAQVSSDQYSKVMQEQNSPPGEGSNQLEHRGTWNGAASIFEAQTQLNTESLETEQGAQNSKHTQREVSKPSTPGAESPLVDDLDYDPAQLSTIPFSELRNQSFDKDPKAAGSVLSAQWTEKPIKDQLVYASSLSPTLQRPFLNALPISQWDEAGEWFVQQFAELVGKLSAARRQKRKVAEQFEDEIAERQKKVMRRDQHLDSGLQGMRMGGTSLLERHNTPK